MFTLELSTNLQYIWIDITNHSDKIVCKHQHLLTRTMVRENEGLDEVPRYEVGEEGEILMDIEFGTQHGSSGMIWSELADEWRPATWADIKVAAIPPDDQGKDVEGSATVTALEGATWEGLGEGESTVTAFEGEEEEDVMDVTSAGQFESDEGATASDTRPAKDQAKITMDNLEFWKSQTQACITELQDKLKNVTLDNDGIKQLNKIRKMRVFESRPPTSLPKPPRTLPTASMSRTHEHQDKGFPKTLKKNVTTRTKRQGRQFQDTMQLVNEGLAKSYKDDVWGDLTHLDLDADAVKEILMCSKYTKEDRKKFQDKLRKAHTYWECVQCKTFNPDVFGEDGKYIGCSSCEKWSHYNCSGLSSEATEDEEEAWKCKHCQNISTQSQRTRISRKK